jgi:transposase
MVYLTRKKKGEKYYLYLEESVWVDGRSRRLWQKYLGPEDRLSELKFTGLLAKHSNNIDINIYEFGVSGALWQIAKEIGLAEIIDNNTEKTRKIGLSLGEYLVIAAINRCAAPCSKAKLSKWFQKDWISNQFDIKPSVLNAQTYWNHFQYLSKETLQSIEVDLNRTVIKKFNLKIDSLFYDPTNFFTFSKGGPDKTLLQFGHSKENRNGNRLVSYSLLCARESGVPLMHDTYAGNTNDVKKFKDVPLDITKRLAELGHDPKDVTLVFDKGNHSKEAFDAIEGAKFGFIVSARNSTQKDLLLIARDKFTNITLPITNKSVGYFKTTRKIYGVERDVYVVLDPKKEKRHTLRFEEQLNDKIKDIEEFFKSRLNLKKWRDKDAVDVKLLSMIGRNPFKSILQYSLQGSYAKLIYSLSVDEKAKNKHIETLGRTILYTNRVDWMPEAIIWGYREQYIVEHAFRNMKSPTSIAVRPMYHHSDRSIRAHVFICVLGLLLISLARLKLARNSVPISYDELLDNLRSVRALKIKTSAKADSLWKMEAFGKDAAKLAKKFKLKALLRD